MSAVSSGRGAEPRLDSAVTTNFPTHRVSGAARGESAFPLTAHQTRRLVKTQTRRDDCEHRWVRIKHECGAAFVIPRKCRTRICRKCGAAMTNDRIKRWLPLSRLFSHVRQGEPRARFVTLTFPDAELQWSGNEELKHWVRKRTEFLRKFFMGKDTPKRWGVRGYLAVWEFTRNPETKRLHPHLHILVWSDFVPWQQLQARWQAATGAWNVNLKEVPQDSSARALGYILKYVNKPWKDIPEDIQAVAFYRTRRITATGAFYGKQLGRNLEAATQPEERRVVRLLCTGCGVLHGVHGPRQPGKPLVPIGEWRTVGHADPDSDPCAVMMAFDWDGNMLWDDAQAVKLTAAAPQAAPFVAAAAADRDFAAAEREAIQLA